AAVIDIGRIRDLKGVTVKGGTIRVGAMTTHAELAASSELAEQCHALAQAAAGVGDPAVRNRGTIGGNVAHADPASDLPTVLVALDARMIAVGPRGERTIDAGSFFTGIMTTALEENEILAAIVVPAAGAGEGSAYVKFIHPASRYAVLGAAASVRVKDGICTAASVAVGGLLPSARRARAVETALTGAAPTDAQVATAAARIDADLGDEVTGDIFAAAEYRGAM